MKDLFIVSVINSENEIAFVSRFTFNGESLLVGGSDAFNCARVFYSRDAANDAINKLKASGALKGFHVEIHTYKLTNPFIS